MKHYRHGLRNKPEYTIWKKMRQRCNSKTNKDYPYYGGRGITIDKTWDNFANFYKDMGPKPNRKYELDRINNDGPYTKANCRWTTRQIQCINKRVLIKKTSKYRHVSYHKVTGKWMSSVKRGQKSFYLGVFETEEKAHSVAINFLSRSAN